MANEQAPKRKSRIEISEAQEIFGKTLMMQFRVDREANTGVLAVGRQFDDYEALTIFVAPNTDTTDELIFPKFLDGERVNYVSSPIPEFHHEVS